VRGPGLPGHGHRPAWEYASEEQYITTPALEVSNLWRAAALPTGIALMMVFAALRLLRESPWRAAVRPLPWSAWWWAHSGWAAACSRTWGAGTC
jgi:hypothetical protein